MILTFLTKYRDWGLLLLRVGIGLSFVLLHGGPKLLAGPQLWTQLGAATGVVGITFAPTFWGFMAMFAEFFGGICFVLGFFFRPACILLLVTMAMATTTHLSRGDTWAKSSHPLEVGTVFLAMLLIGPGKYSLDRQ